MANLLGAIGNAQPVSQFIDTALKYQTVQSNLETQRMQQQKLRDEEIQRKKDMTEYDPESVVSLHPKPYQDIVRSALAPYRDPNTGLVQGIHARNVPKYIKENVELHTTLLTSEHQQLTKDNMKLAESQIPADQDQLAKNFKRQADIAKELRLGKDKALTVAKKGDIGTVDESGKLTRFEGSDTQEVDMSKTPLGQINTVNGMEYVYPSSDGTKPMLSGGDIYDPKYHGPMQKFGSDPKTVDAIWMDSARVLKDPESTPEERAKATQDIETAKDIIKTRGEDRFAGLHGEMMIGTTTSGTPVYKDTRQAGQPAFIFGPKGEKQIYTGVIAPRAEALPLSGGEPAAKSAEYKASSAELRRLQGQRGVVMAFAKTAELNLELAAQLIDAVPESEIPIINKALREGGRKITGSSATAKFFAALRTGINEYAKVTSSATGGGVTSDQARKEVEDMLYEGYTKGQFRDVVKDVLRVDLNNRKVGYDLQIDYLKKELGGGTEAPKAPMTGPVKVWNPATKTFDVRQ
jgi:hypothetical protein